MENDRGYISGENWYNESENIEYEAVYYSDSDSDYSDTEVEENLPPHFINVESHESEENYEQEQVTEMTAHEMQRRLDKEREEEKEKEKTAREKKEKKKSKEEYNKKKKTQSNAYEGGACGSNDDGYVARNNTEQKKVRFERERSAPIPIPARAHREEEIFDMEMEIDEFIASELERNRIDFAAYDGLDEQLEMERLTIEEENRFENGFEFNIHIPMEYRWSDFDECCIGICNPELESRMRAIRRSRGRIDIAEIMKVYMEVSETKLTEMHKIERGKLQEELYKKEKKLDKTEAELKEARQDRAIAQGQVRIINAKLQAKMEELIAEKTYVNQKEQIIQEWCEGNKEAEKALEDMGKENKKLLKETAELKMTIQEMKKQDRRKF